MLAMVTAGSMITGPRCRDRFWLNLTLPETLVFDSPQQTGRHSDRDRVSPVGHAAQQGGCRSLSFGGEGTEALGARFGPPRGAGGEGLLWRKPAPRPEPGHVGRRLMSHTGHPLHGRFTARPELPARATGSRSHRRLRREGKRRTHVPPALSLRAPCEPQTQQTQLRARARDADHVSPFPSPPAPCWRGALEGGVRMLRPEVHTLTCSTTAGPSKGVLPGG